MTLPAHPETEATASAERRLVTVLFADVVDLTSLSRSAWTRKTGAAPSARSFP